MKTIVSSLVLATALCACTQDANIGLTLDASSTADAADPGDAGSDNDGGPRGDAGTADAGTNDGGNAGDGGLLDAGPPTSCVTDSWCGPDQFCDANYGQRVGDCAACPIQDAIPCIGGQTHVYAYGNSCGLAACDCPQGTARDPSGECRPNTSLPWLHLDPSTLHFFWLPINSERLAVAGFDPVAQKCATLIWDYSNNGFSPPGPHCNDFFPSFPYVLVQSSTAPCPDLWDYNSSLQVLQADGCIDPSGLVDANVQVSGTSFVGGIEVSNRRTQQPWPVSFVFKYSTDVMGEHAYVQSKDPNGEIAWIHIIADGATFPLGDSCVTEICGEAPIQCGFNAAQVKDVIVPGDFGGQLAATWDGYLRVMPIATACSVREPAHPRNYEVEVCFGYGTLQTGQGELVSTPNCHRFPFQYPSDEVEIIISDGG